MILKAERLAALGFAHALPERDVSDAQLLAAIEGRAIAQVKQVHGARVTETAGEEADAIVARRGRGAVGVRVADCVPVLVADQDSGDVAAIHAGWRGVVAGVVRAGVERLGGKKMVAAIGPCIGPCCFEVGRDVAAKIGCVVRESGDKAWVDLRAAVEAELRACGVVEVENVAGCTKHELARFHSFRRDGSSSGRMLAAIAARAM